MIYIYMIYIYHIYILYYIYRSNIYISYIYIYHIYIYYYCPTTVYIPSWLIFLDLPVAPTSPGSPNPARDRRRSGSLAERRASWSHLVGLRSCPWEIRKHQWWNLKSYKFWWNLIVFSHWLLEETANLMSSVVKNQDTSDISDEIWKATKGYKSKTWIQGTLSLPINQLG